MTTKTELQTKIGSLAQRITVLQSELEGLRGEEKIIRGRMVGSKVAGGEVEAAANGASHHLRENLTRQDVLDEAIGELEKQRGEAQRELDDIILAETSIPWQEFEADLWRGVAALQKQMVEMNRQILALYARANQTPATTPDGVEFKQKAPLALQAVNNGLFQAWQGLESLNQRSPHRVNWGGDGSGVPGFGKKL